MDEICFHDVSFIFLYFITLKMSPPSVPEDTKAKLRKQKGEQEPMAESSQSLKKKKSSSVK